MEDAVEKRKQEIAEKSGSAKITKGDDLDIISPEPEIFKLGDKEFKIYPLPMIKQKLLVRMTKLAPEESEENIDEMAELYAQILGTEKEFILNNMNGAKIVEFRAIVSRAETKSIQGVVDQIKKKRDTEEASAGS